jgi:hypothetical protein
MSRSADPCKKLQTCTKPWAVTTVQRIGSGRCNTLWGLVICAFDWRRTCGRGAWRDDPEAEGAKWAAAWSSELQALKCLLRLDPCWRLLCTFIVQSSDVTDAKFRAMTTVQSDALTTALELRWMKPGGECCSSLSLKRGFWGRATVLYSNDSAMSNCRCLLVQTCNVGI